jgi:hypothetical protein
MNKECLIHYTNARIMQYMGYFDYALSEINICLSKNPQELLAIIFKAKIL